MSALLETPSDMHRIAADIRSSSDQVREHARRLVAGSETTRWYSPAARQFRDHVDELARHLMRAADRLDGAAHALDCHARRVHDVLAAPAHVAEAVGKTFGHAVGL